MRDYELMVVLDPNLDDTGVEAATARVASIVAARGGEVDGAQLFGRRRLAYPIARHRDGIFLLFRPRLRPEVVPEVERALQLTESVIRHLLVRADTVPPVAAHA